MGTTVTFGVTGTTLAAAYFPQLVAFSTGTKPTAATVTAIINKAAARMCAALIAEGLTPATVATTATTNEYAVCADIIEKASARRVWEIHTAGRGDAKEAMDELKDEVEAFYKRLDKMGPEAIGLTATAGDEPNGPRTHIDNNSLDIGDADDLSTLVPKFRRDDQL